MKLSLAAKIVLVLDISQNGVYPSESAITELSRYVDDISTRYGKYRQHLDFGTAILKARMEVVQMMLDEVDVVEDDGAQIGGSGTSSTPSPRS